MNQIRKIYETLLKTYGPQGWWPLVNHDGCNPTKSGSVHGYHPGNYSFPCTDEERFEICIGAILTQNTSWPQVEKALMNLNRLGAISPKKILQVDLDKLKAAIKPAGYFNQKAKKVKEFAKFYIELKEKIPSREELLGIWGIGPETADSMLLYAFKVPSFVVDAYTRRIFAHLRLIDQNASYDEIKELFEKSLAPDIIIYQEYHALIVEHAKHHYNKKPYGKDELIG